MIWIPKMAKLLVVYKDPPGSQINTLKLVKIAQPLIEVASRDSKELNSRYLNVHR